MNLLIVGAGNIAKEYCKVVKSMNISPVVIGRGEMNARLFEKEMNVSVIRGGLEEGLKKLNEMPTHAIVTVNAEQLSIATQKLIEFGVKNILVEKPAGIFKEEIKKISDMAEIKKCNVYVAYNRRFYASTEKALQIIAEDGGVSSFNFEFTEWGHVVKTTSHPALVKENWFVANSTHVIDLAFFLGGSPIDMVSFVKDSLEWHSKGAVYAGAGITNKGAIFSYQANWKAPGRWAVEILTEKHRLYFRPMEKLSVQDIGSVSINEVEIDDELDKLYKPGFYKQTESFLQNLDDKKKITIQEQLKNMEVYQKMELGR